MGFLARIFGRCSTPLLADRGAWRHLDGTLYVDLRRTQLLDAPGSALRVEDNDLPARVLVVRGKDDGWHAFENRCSHMGRRVDRLEGSDHLECCSVGRTTWDRLGRRLTGSGEYDLKAYAIRRDGDMLVVQLAARA